MNLDLDLFSDLDHNYSDLDLRSFLCKIARICTIKPVDEVCVAVELVLDDVVEDLEEEEDEVVVGGR